MKTISVRISGLALLLLFRITGQPALLQGQTDYYNTDRNRPVRIEDAHPTELYAVEVKLAPLRIEQEADGGFSRWTFQPEIAYGVLPRTSVEIGLPITATEDGPTSISVVEISAFHNLNAETRGLPALAVRGDLEIPVRGDGPDDVVPSLTGILTRTLPIARVHLNAGYTFASDDVAGDASPHAEGRWLAGFAVDRAFPLRALLLIGDVHVIQPMQEEESVLWNAGVGVRYQVSPTLGVDAGVGRRFADDSGWYVTVGSALHLGIRRLPGGTR